MSEHFDGERSFVAGKIRGVRSFRVPSEGDRVTGCTFTEDWNPGLNHAKHIGSTHNVQVTNWLRNGRGEIPAHEVAGMGCNCGFYGFTDGSDDYAYYNSSVTGIIEGFGTVTLGTRGFRASKAKIVAFIDDKRPWSDPAEEKDKRPAYGRWDSFSILMGQVRPWVLKANGVSGVLVFVAGAMIPHLVAGITVSVVGLLLLAVLGVVTLARRHALQLAYEEALRIVTASMEVKPRRHRSPFLDQFLAHPDWQDIPVYRTREEAIKAFPLGLVGPDA